MHDQSEWKQEQLSEAVAAAERSLDRLAAVMPTASPEDRQRLAVAIDYISSGVGRARETTIMAAKDAAARSA